MPQTLTDDLWVNIESDNGLVPSGTKPLTERNKSLAEPMLAHFYVAIWRHQATMSWIISVSINMMRNIQVDPRYPSRVSLVYIQESTSGYALEHALCQTSVNR